MQCKKALLLGIAYIVNHLYFCSKEYEHRSLIEKKMQIQKENTRQKIIETARKEFLKKTYKSVSMRQIAKLSKIGLSNIYNYFENKDKIFSTILSPLLKEFDFFLEEHNSEKNVSVHVFVSQSYQREILETYLALIKKYKDELNLLLFKSAGSSYENFREEFTDKHTQLGMEYLNKMKCKYPQIHTSISDFFIHTMSAWQLAIIGEVVSHNELSNEDIELFLSEHIAFATAGWKTLMKA